MNDKLIRCLIVDDEPAARGALRSLLAEEADVEIVGELADGESALSFIRKEGPDLLFLDIQMPEMDGFSVLRQLEPSRMPVIVFVTAYDQYALRAFDSEAMDYLLKPFSDERFQQAMGRARRQILAGRIGALSDELRRVLNRTDTGEDAGEYRSRLVIKSDGRITIIPVADVDWLEADGDVVKVHTARRASYLLRETMKDLESQLDPGIFVRIHRSTIINVDRIKELEPYFKGDYVVLLSDGTRLKLSRRFKDRLEGLLGRSL
jgi:two-component system LytT family response regulator